MFVELLLASAFMAGAASGRKKQQLERQDNQHNPHVADAAACLEQLGYGPSEAATRALVAAKQHPDGDLDTLVNAALRL